MLVLVQYGRRQLSLALDDDASLKRLQDEITAITGVPSAQQRIVMGAKAFVGTAEHSDTLLRALAERALTHAQLETFKDASVLRATLFTSNANELIEAPSSPSSASTSLESTAPPDIEQWLQVCSKVTVGAPVRQPSFVFTYFADAAKELGSGVDESSMLIPVCGPCAHTCLGIKDVAVLDSIPYLRKPFLCRCSTILKTGHSCFWEEDVLPSCTEADGLRQAVAREWEVQASYFVRAIAADSKAKLRREQADAEEKFTSQLRSSMNLFSQYQDSAAQHAALQVIPTSQLMHRATLALQALDAEQQMLTNINEQVFLQLLYWFKDSFFKWVDRPLCSCGGRTHPIQTPGTPTPEERSNWATVVEMYQCDTCQGEVRFPRYNRAQRLLTWRQGRCGEWTNCFLLLATSMGFECRYVLDFTDHVWVEVYSSATQRWVHCDPCERAYDTPLLYEGGWKKSLSYVFAFSDSECVDVIRRYSRHPCWLPSRITVSEAFVNALVTTLDGDHCGGLTAERLALLRSRRQTEWNELLNGPGDAMAAFHARTTGSVEWRLQRGEMGLTEGAAAAASSRICEFYDCWRDNIDVVRMCRVTGPEALSSGASIVKEVGPLVTVTSEGLRLGPHKSATVISSRVPIVLEMGFRLTMTCKLDVASGTPPGDASCVQLALGKLLAVELSLKTQSATTAALELHLNVNREGTYHKRGSPRSYPTESLASAIVTADGGSMTCRVEVVLDSLGGLRAEVSAATCSLGAGSMVPLFGPHSTSPWVELSGRQSCITGCTISAGFE